MSNLHTDCADSAVPTACNCTQHLPEVYGHHPNCRLASIEDRAVGALARRLHEAREKVEERQRLLRGAKRDRDLLILKLAHAGIVERAIAPIAGVSNIRVNQVKADGIEGWRKRYGVEAWMP